MEIDQYNDDQYRDDEFSVDDIEEYPIEFGNAHQLYLQEVALRLATEELMEHIRQRVWTRQPIELTPDMLDGVDTTRLASAINNELEQLYNQFRFARGRAERKEVQRMVNSLTLVGDNFVTM
jgi:hypothetical protein